MRWTNYWEKYNADLRRINQQLSRGVINQKEADELRIQAERDRNLIPEGFVRCPHCYCHVTPGNFCSQCGKPLDNSQS